MSFPRQNRRGFGQDRQVPLYGTFQRGILRKENLEGSIAIWDLLIIGTGPAGISAVLTAKAKGLLFLWFDRRGLSDKEAKAERVLNYPGLSQVTGQELRETFLRHVDGLVISIREKRVAAIYDMGGSIPPAPVRTYTKVSQ